MRESEWYKITICTSCHKRLNRHNELYSGGVCPKCGRDSHSTICDTKTVIVKRIKHYSWWQIFDRKSTYVGRDEFSKIWLSEN